MQRSILNEAIAPTPGVCVTLTEEKKNKNIKKRRQADRQKRSTDFNVFLINENGQFAGKDNEDFIQ